MKLSNLYTTDEKAINWKNSRSTENLDEGFICARDVKMLFLGEEAAYNIVNTQLDNSNVWVCAKNCNFGRYLCKSTNYKDIIFDKDTSNFILVNTENNFAYGNNSSFIRFYFFKDEKYQIGKPEYFCHGYNRTSNLISGSTTQRKDWIKYTMPINNMTLHDCILYAEVKFRTENDLMNDIAIGYDEYLKTYGANSHSNIKTIITGFKFSYYRNNKPADDFTDYDTLKRTLTSRFLISITVDYKSDDVNNINSLCETMLNSDYYITAGGINFNLTKGSYSSLNSGTSTMFAVDSNDVGITIFNKQRGATFNNTNKMNGIYTINGSKYVIYHYSEETTNYIWIGYSFLESDLTNFLNSTGLFWTGTLDTAINANLYNITDENVHIGFIDEYGNTNGQGTNGINCNTVNSFGWDDIQQSPFDPNRKNLTEPTETDEISLNHANVNPSKYFNSMYALSLETCNQFSGWLFNPDNNIFETILAGLKMNGNNPISSIISMKLFPFDLSKFSLSTAKIKIGRVSSEISAYRLTQTDFIFNVGSINIVPYFYNFLDYEPYTSVQVYLPYCGTCNINTSIVMNKTLTIEYIIDILTGSCTAVISADNLPFLYKNGVIGSDISVTAENSAQFASNVLSATLGFVGNAVALNPVGVAKSSIDLAMSGKSQIETSGNSTPTCNLYQPQNVYFTITRPIENLPKNYGSTIGYICNKTCKVGDLKGFTVCNNARIETSATNDEKNMILNIMNSGFYI